MKKIFLPLISVLLISSAVFAQSIIISDKGTAIPNGGSINVWGEYNSLIEVHLSVTNNTFSTMNIKVKKIEQSIVAGSINYFCWTECYSPSIFVSPDSLVFSAGLTDSVSFIADYMPMNNAGTSIITYVFFNSSNPNDSTALDIHFYGSPTGIDTRATKVDFPNVYPNPAKTSVTFDYTFSPEALPARILIRDMLGAIVKQVELPSFTGKVVVPVEELPNGIYFYSLMLGNEVHTTRKLLIRR